MNNRVYTISEEDVSERIDKFLTAECDDLSRAYLQKIIEKGNVLVNDKVVKSNYKLRLNDLVLLSIDEPEELDIPAEDIPLDIIYEDDDVILINKPKGMVVHPAAGHFTGTLVNALLFHCKDSLSSINGVLRPGIVHRIDMDTTGVIVVCKNDIAHRSLAEQLKDHSITRKYNAIVYHSMSEEDGTVNKPIGRHPNDRKKMAITPGGGRSAVTHYRVIEGLSSRYTHIECQLETGRTHQIRVHMASINHPLLGDEVYGPKNPPIKNIQGQALHARVLGFIHPRTDEYVEFEAPLPDYFEDLLRKLR